jgi:hypothetical protein
MTAVLALNLVLAIVVVGALLRLLSWAIISSRADQLPVKAANRQPVPRPYGPRPHAPRPHAPRARWSSAHRSQQDAGKPVAN